MRLRALLVLVAAAVLAATASATSFVVPTDEEMIQRSDAIVVATVEGSYVQERENTIETVYELRVKRALKGAGRSGELVRVVTLGGALEDRGVIVHGEARFDFGDQVLVFLTNDNGRWRPTEMTLGKFRFATSTAGERLLVRDMEDVVGWDHAGREHHENVRREEGFLRFIEERVRGERGAHDYEVDSADVTLDTSSRETFEIASHGTYPAASYTSWISNLPTRFANVSAGVNFYKRSDQNIAGAADGGVLVIQNGLAAWTNECGSVINLIYAGQRATPSANHDGINMVEYNDPQGRISGSWGGSGTIGITFSSYNGQHSFDGQTWWSVGDADVVFQDGFPATHGAFPSAMTHELGHAIGWRHSNQNSTGGACDPSVQECTSAAIMNSSVSSAYGYTLQPWDVNASRAVYPGGTCGPTCTAPAITSQPSSTTITAGSSATLTVTATGTAPLSYQWYAGTSGNTSAPIAGATSSSITVSPSSTTSYWVRVSNSCGSANSATATVTVTAPPPPPPPGSAIKNDFNGDGRSDVLWFNSSTGQIQIWFMNGTTRTTATPGSAPAGWTPRFIGDFNADGRADIFWRSTSGANSVWLMNGGTILSRTDMPAVTDPGWEPQGVGDFDGNGTADIMWRSSNTGQNSIWFMNGTTRTVSMLPTMDTSWTPIVFGDFNGNGRTDIFWRQTTGANMVWLMSGATVVTNAAMPTVSDLNEVPQGSGDFNGDGRFDIFWRNAATGHNSLWLMNGTSRTIAFLPALTGTWQPRAFGDFDADGTWDVFWRDSFGNTAVWLIDNAAITTRADMPAMSTAWEPVPLRDEAPAPPPPPPPGSDPLKKDFNGDGRSDVLWFNSSTGQIQIWFMNGTTRTTATPGSAPAGWTPRAIGDFNADGRADIFWRSTSGGNSVWTMNGSTIVSRTDMPSVTDPGWEPQGAGDFDGNGTADIMWRSSNTGQNSIWFMNGATRTIGGLPVVDPSWTPIVFGDFNGDGRTDIFWRHSTGATAVWLMNGATVVTNASMPAVSDTNEVPQGAGDFNGDGRFDIFWRNVATGHNSLWLMNGASRTISFLPSVATNWQPRYFGDFNGDDTWDVFWRDNAGNVSVWLMANAAVATNASMGTMSTAWVPVTTK